MNTRKLIEDGDEDIKGELLDVPCFVTTVITADQRSELVYLTQNRKKERPRDRTFNIGREWFNWQWSAHRATAFSREKATNLVEKLQKIWPYEKFSVVPAVRPDDYIE